MNKDDFNILVAKCGRSIGLKGSLRIVIYTDFLEIFTRGNILKCGDSLLHIEDFDASVQRIKFAEISDIESAKKLNLLQLYATKEATLKYCKLNDGEFFWFDMIGLRLYDKDLLLGEVIDIQRIANINYLIIQTDARFKSPKTFMVPYISRYIIQTDLESKCIYSNDTLGILEES